MILRRPVPRRLSAGAFVVLVLAAAVLLPLGLIEAQSPPAKRPLTVEEAIMRSPSCVACHEGAWADQGPKRPGAAPKEGHDKLMKMHGDMNKLMSRLREQRVAVEATEKELRQILERLEAATGSKPSARPNTDRRLDEVEKKLELLLKELKDIKDAQRPKSGSRPGASSRPPSDVLYLNQRTL